MKGWTRWLRSLIPAFWETKVGKSQGQEFETSLANMVKPVSTKNTKISWAWWNHLLCWLLKRLRQENHLNLEGGGRSKLTLQPGGHSKTPSQKKEKKKGTKEFQVVTLNNYLKKMKKLQEAVKGFRLHAYITTSIILRTHY